MPSPAADQATVRGVLQRNAADNNRGVLSSLIGSFVSFVISIFVFFLFLQDPDATKFVVFLVMFGMALVFHSVLVMIR